MKLLQNEKYVILYLKDCEYVECSEDFFCMKIDCLYGIVSSGNYKKTLCNGCDDDGLIHNLVRELKIGDKCYNGLIELKINNYPNLTVFIVGKNSFQRIILFELTNCEKLEELIINEWSMNNTNSCQLRSM